MSFIQTTVGDPSAGDIIFTVITLNKDSQERQVARRLLQKEPKEGINADL